MIKEKVKQITNNLELVLLILILIASTLCITNIKWFEKLQIAIAFVMIGYLGFRIIKKNPIKLIQSKLDIFVMMLVISTIIPFIANTYISLQTTVTGILTYTTMLWIYILTRQIVRKNEKYVQYIKNILIVIAMILIGIGIENLLGNRIFGLLGIDNIANGEMRLVSLVGNPNAFASFILLVLIISITEMLNGKKAKTRIGYATCNTICVLGFILTYSKLAFLIFLCIMIGYFIILKGKMKKIYLLQNIVISFIFSIIYIGIFQKLMQYSYYITIGIFTILWIQITILVNIAFEKIAINIEKMDGRKIAILVLIFSLVSITWFLLELQNKVPFVVFTENSELTYQAKKINKIKANEKYIFTFDIEAFVEEEIDEFFSIRIIERDSKSLEEIQSKEIRFSNFSGKKEIEMVTSPYTSEIKLEFKRKDQKISKRLEIKKLEVNHKEMALEYKHLPAKLIEKVKDINIQYKTAQERIQFIKDGLKLISNQFLTGIGAQGWQYVYGQVQEYGYTSKDVHSYYIQIWLEFGMLGLIGMIGIIGCIIKGIKQTDMQYRGFQIGILAMLLHTAMDLDMSLVFMKIILFSILGILATISQSNKVNKKRSYFSSVILISCCIGTIILLFKPQMYQKRLAVSKLEKEQKRVEIGTDEYREYNRKIMEECSKVIQYEKYDSIQNHYEYKKIENCIQANEKEIENVVEQYYKRIKDDKNKWKYNCVAILEKSNSITVVNKMLEEQNNPKLYKSMVKLAKVVIDEYEVTKEQLRLALNDKHKQLEEELEYKNLLDNYHYANWIYNEYALKIVK